MIELGQLEAKHREFENRNARVIAVSIEDQEAAKATQEAFPHLVVVADADRRLSEAIDVVDRQTAPDGGATAAPTTLLIDGNGIVRWTFRADRFLERLTPEQVLAAFDEKMPRSLSK